MSDTMLEMKFQIFEKKRRTQFLYLFVIMLGMNMANIFAQNQIELDKAGNYLIAPEATSYQWFKNGLLLDNQVKSKLVVKESGLYEVVLIQENGKKVVLKSMVEVNANGIRKIIIIGDSTASLYNSGDYPRNGWAQVLQPFFNIDSIQVLDRALSGRSSKSFYTDPTGWPVVLNDLKKGDFLLIQFGHNDEKTGDTERYTEPFTTFKDYLSIYIDTALARGAYPVLLTPIHRNNWNGSTIKDSHGDYPVAMRELAVAKNIPLIDMHVKSKELFESYGQNDVTNQFFMNLPANVYQNYLDGNSDNTHLQDRGAFELCKKVIEAIEEQKNTTTLALLAPGVQDAVFVKVMADPALSATISGFGVVPRASEVSLTQSPKSGYAFMNWADGAFTSDEDVYTFTADTNVLYMKAKFGEGYKVTLSRSPSAGGSVMGSGSYLINELVSITARPKEGYVFSHWESGEAIISEDTTYTFTMGNENITCKAVFSLANGISQVTNEYFRIYPVPVSGKLNISSSSTIHKIEVMDLTGRIEIALELNTKTIQIETDEFSKGVKIVRIITKEGDFRKRILVN